MTAYEEPKKSAASCSVDEILRLQKEANAKLIAAVPDMLKVLRKFMDFKDSEYVPNGLFERARIAIEKATGEVE